MRDLLTRIAAWVVERPAPVMAIAVLVSLVGAVGALSLEARPRPRLAGRLGLGGVRPPPRTSTSASATSRCGSWSRATSRELVLTENLGTLLALEGCLAGSAPDGARCSGNQRPRRSASASPPSSRPQVVFGPATFLNQTAIAAEDVLKRSDGSGPGAGARRRARPRRRAPASAACPRTSRRPTPRPPTRRCWPQFQQQLLEAATEYGLTGVPQHRRSRPTSARRLRPAPAARHAEGPLQLPLPQPRRGDDHGPPDARPRRGASASAAIGLFRDAVEDPAVRPARRRATWSAACR